MMREKEEGEGMVRKKEELKVSIWTMFAHADTVDLWLMALGFLGAVGDGLATPVMLLILSMIMNNMSNASLSSSDPSLFVHSINKNAVNLCYMACGSWVVSFLEGYCWTRTGERQASRMRARYLKAVLRQDVGYFDLQEASTTEVVTSISNDSLVVQDAISEKDGCCHMDAT